MHKRKNIFFILILMAGFNMHANGQALPDSIIKKYENAKTGEEKLNGLYSYLNKLREESSFLPKATLLTDFLRLKKDMRNLDLIQLGINDQLSKTGDYATALSSDLEITNRFEQNNDKRGILSAYRQLSTAYFYAGDGEKDIVYGKKALLLAEELNKIDILSSITNNLSTSFAQKNMPDSALVYARKSLHYAKQSTQDDIYQQTGVLGTLAEAFITNKQYDSALIYSRLDLSADFNRQDLSIAWTLNDLSQIFLETTHFDSSRYYAHRAAGVSSALGFKDQLQRAYEYLSLSFDKTNNSDSAFKYLQLAVVIKDSLYSNDKTKQVQGIIAREQTRLQELEKERHDFQNRIRIYSLIAGLILLSIAAFFLYRNNRHKQTANISLREQKEKVETTLKELKATQQQLIHSEKMASLGELTAGIAHEIQNPLNFVNNFSEINNELIEELKIQKSKVKNEEEEELLNDIFQNNEKINHHGKRADAIVKGMLQHSQSGKGQKEPTDINALCDEYLRLSYHGFRAKDKSLPAGQAGFNATLKTDFDESLSAGEAGIGKINIIPQDMGRVIMNLLTNAFYAVNEKTLSAATAPTAAGYEPLVSITTKKINAGIQIAVTDNGNGIPQHIIDKIFQPFFTTKPTGQGTGLGLSMSYDIIKAHGGEIKIDSKENEGSTFTIYLLLNNSQ